MRNIKAAFHICTIQLRKNILSQRTVVMALLVSLYIYAMLQPVSDFAYAVGYKATPFGVVFLVCDSVVQMILMAGVVVIFSNAPFEDESHPYLIVRAGKGVWVFGNSLYILLMSSLYVLFIWLISIVALIPNVDFTMAWGKVWGTLAATNAGEQYGILFTVHNGIRTYYEPTIALGSTLLLEWGCSVFLGASVYLGNKFTDKPIGTWIGAAFVLFDITIYNIFYGPWMAYSPLSLAMITNFIRSRWDFTVSYAVMFYIIGLVAMTAINYAKEKIVLK